MRKSGFRLSLLIITIAAICLLAAYPSFAASSEKFYQYEEDIFDDWDICRTRAYWNDGFFQITSETTFSPVIINLESLGENADRAYELGEQFADEYPDPNQRAEKIFYFVRDHVRYTPDVDQFNYEEWAINADELATTIEEDGFGRGDCEDMAILLAVMYKGAGYRSAIVLPPGHAAALVYLPNYKKANFLTLGDEAGWVWAEATGRNNPFGWIPDEYRGESLAACEVSGGDAEEGQKSTGPGTEMVKTGVNIILIATPFITVIFLMGIILMFALKRHLNHSGR